MCYLTLGLNRLIPIFLCLFISLAGCKKKKDEEPTPTSTPTPAPVAVSSMTAVVNGINWQMANNTYNTYKSSGSYGFSGRTSYDPPNTMISFSFPYTIGTMTVGSGGFGGYYRDSSQAYHYIQSGTLHLTQLDTNGSFGLPSKVKGTFTFVTTTSITVTNGVIDWTKPN